MHRRGAASVAAIWGIAVCGLVGLGLGLGGCSDSDGDGNDGAAVSNGPAPTDNDPGPNDTSNGPITVQGVMHLDPATGCITLQTDEGELGLAFAEYEIGDIGGPALVQKLNDRPLVARDLDTIVVTGINGGSTPAECGTPFSVLNLTSVLPAP